jgi:hypothetical protein
VCYLKFGKISSIPSKGFKVYGDSYPFYIFGIAAIFFNLVTFVYLMTLRIYNRRINFIRNHTKFYAFSKSCNVYYIYIIMTYFLLVIFGVLWWSITKDFIILFSCVFLPLMYESIMVLYYNWQINDYMLVGDVAAYN